MAHTKFDKSLKEKISFFSLKDSDCLIYSNKYAVALKYDRKIKPAPFVVYKSKDVAETLKLAQFFKITKIKHKIANKIFKTTEYGEIIGYDLFDIIAEILAEIYNSRDENEY